MLTFCRKGLEPSLAALVQMFFTYDGHFDEKGYAQVVMSIGNLGQREPGFDFGILSEESLLNLYSWAARTEGLKEDGNGLEEQNSPDLLKLFLIFNDDLLDRYAKVKRSAYRYEDRPVLRMIFAQRFPQNDIVEIDYGKLVFAQAYK